MRRVKNQHIGSRRRCPLACGSSCSFRGHHHGAEIVPAIFRRVNSRPCVANGAGAMAHPPSAGYLMRDLVQILRTSARRCRLHRGCGARSILPSVKTFPRRVYVLTEKNPMKEHKYPVVGRCPLVAPESAPEGFSFSLHAVQDTATKNRWRCSLWEELEPKAHRNQYQS